MEWQGLLEHGQRERRAKETETWRWCTHQTVPTAAKMSCVGDACWSFEPEHNNQSSFQACTTNSVQDMLGWLWNAERFANQTLYGKPKAHLYMIYLLAKVQCNRTWCKASVELMQLQVGQQRGEGGWGGGLTGWTTWRSNTGIGSPCDSCCWCSFIQSFSKSTNPVRSADAAILWVNHKYSAMFSCWIVLRKPHVPLLRQMDSAVGIIRCLDVAQPNTTQ